MSIMTVNINGKPLFKITAPYKAIDHVHKLPHNGIDLSMPEGTTILSPVEGIVDRVIIDNTQIGNGVVIKLENGNNLLFGHLSKIKVREGDIISIGEKIGSSGNTGYSTGAHLHIGLTDIDGNFIDPKKYERLFQSVSRDNLIGDGVWDNLKSVKDSLFGIGDFLNDIRDVGLFYAFTGNTFEEWISITSKNLLMSFLNNSNVILVIPAIALMFATFLIGVNKYTKWIIPLWFLYFVCIVLKAQLLSQGW